MSTAYSAVEFERDQSFQSVTNRFKEAGKEITIEDFSLLIKKASAMLDSVEPGERQKKLTALAQEALACGIYHLVEGNVTKDGIITNAQPLFDLVAITRAMDKRLAAPVGPVHATYLPYDFTQLFPTKIHFSSHDDMTGVVLTAVMAKQPLRHNQNRAAILQLLGPQ